ncbi:hypothetical protein [Rufibacter quisquiliarum]|uniref:Uncharacterized protein n=1 Tax=Rufibacter quisquiliarum TaxID=1549639 RepID=A0A839GRV6_9BACT|nr:hypothetical protein [Rufibacter quisquiliarum]MBA9077607.1 hypothetical protein [Rufibacter quisquiliarum]
MKRKILLTLLGFFCLYGLVRVFFSDQPSEAVLGPSPFLGGNVLHHNAPDSVMVSAGRHYQLGKVGEFFLGKHYREVWAVPVKAKVFHMHEQKGGLQIEKLGGGMQTTSLTLTDSAGRLFALRSVDKDPIEVLPPFWRKTFVGSFVRDQISATNPYAALVVAPLAEAAGVFHPTPSLVYVLPADQDFQQYSNQFGNKLFLMEEKFTTRASLTKKFGNATDLVETEEMLARHYRSSHHRIDQWAYARARLLDLLISDWDRHEGQWDWAEYQQNGETWYKPVPKDRDQALCKYDDGVIPWIATRRFAARKFSSFHPEFQNIFGLTINAAFLDARALPEVSLVDFRRLAREMQMALTDSVLRMAVRRFPPAVYQLVGDETYQNLKSRLKQLPQAAEEYYKVLAKEVAVVGSDERERFVVQRLSQGRTVVEVFRLGEKNINGTKIYSRTFFASETEKISLYGLGGDDFFDLRGHAVVGSYVYVFGGAGGDQVTDESTVEGWRKKTVVEDTDQGVKLVAGPETEAKLARAAAEVPSFVRFRKRE